MYLQIKINNYNICYYTIHNNIKYEQRTNSYSTTETWPLKPAFKKKHINLQEISYQIAPRALLFGGLGSGADVILVILDLVQGGVFVEQVVQLATASGGLLEAVRESFVDYRYALDQRVVYADHPLYPDAVNHLNLE